MYFFVSNSEDGLRVDGPLNHDDALARIEDLTSEDLIPKYRATFVDKVPDEYAPTERVCILKAEVVIPEAQQRVTEWSL